MRPIPPHIALERIAAPQRAPAPPEALAMMASDEIPVVLTQSSSATLWAAALCEHGRLAAAGTILACAVAIAGWPVTASWLLAAGAATFIGLVVRDVASPGFAY